MIRPGRHTPTGRPRVEVSCDAPGCTVSHYAPDETGQHHAGVLAARVGWEIGPYTNGQPTPALCPTHATTTETCTHEIGHGSRATEVQRESRRRDHVPELQKTTAATTDGEAT